jgi:two-component sensor histidine kinase
MPSAELDLTGLAAFAAGFVLGGLIMIRFVARPLPERFVFAPDFRLAYVAMDRRGWWRQPLPPVTRDRLHYAWAACGRPAAELREIFFKADAGHGQLEQRCDLSRYPCVPRNPRESLMAKRATEHYRKASANLARAAQHDRKAAEDHEAGRDEAAIQHAQAARIHTIRAEGHAEKALNAYVEHVHLLMGEVRHRAKNTLSLVQAIAHETATGESESFISRFNERIRALASYQDVLVRNQWSGVELDELVRAQLAHLTDQIGSRIAVHGAARLRLNAAAAQVIGLALSELATNAVKYGALSVAAGRVDIAWRVSGETLEITWTERNGPPVKPPKRRGFGTTVITSLPKMTIDAEAQLDFPPSGVVWRLTCPAANMMLLEEARAKPKSSDGKHHPGT